MLEKKPSVKYPLSDYPTLMKQDLDYRMTPDQFLDELESVIQIGKSNQFATYIYSIKVLEPMNLAKILDLELLARISPDLQPCVSSGFFYDQQISPCPAFSEAVKLMSECSQIIELVLTRGADAGSERKIIQLLRPKIA
jgi:hypothetical protein